MKIYQDSNVFYNEETGDVVYISSIVVKDFDMKSAKEARTDFINWADRIDLDYSFE